VKVRPFFTTQLLGRTASCVAESIPDIEIAWGITFRVIALVA